jgi:NhaA family Na+:H+ antiporter
MRDEAVERTRLAAALRARPVDRLLGPLQRFLQVQAAGGILLLAATVTALAWANSPWGTSYEAFWHTRLRISLGALPPLDHTLAHWINDGLMAVFFFLVGLEIKRELVAGELANPRAAALPIVAAVGGMAAPALVYLALNAGEPTLRGWAIPAATDIAFAVGILGLLGDRVPLGLKVFLTALAIVDDLGAVLVIALFYTAELHGLALAAAAAGLAIALTLNRLHVRSPWPYGVLGIAVWLAMLESGVHATIAGVAMAFAIPARSRLDPAAFGEGVRELLARLEGEPSQRHAVVNAIERACEHVDTPLARIEHMLAPVATFAIMPVFALANAGVALGGELGALAASPVALGAGLGLFLGKQAGVFASSWLAVKAGLASLPAEVRWAQLYGASCLAGIGFTMSLFIAALAFGSGAPRDLDAAKLGILAGSVVSGATGYALLRLVRR